MEIESKKRKTSWKSDYSREFGFLNKVNGENDKAFCMICNSKFDISNGGRAQITKHTETKKHQSSIQASTSNVKIQTFFKNLNTTEDFKSTACEAAWAYHTARHNISFKSNDCSNSLIKCMFDTKFTLARSKTAAIISNVISPAIEAEVNEKLQKLNFVSLMTDTSNRLNVKMLPIIARGFDPENGVCNLNLTLVTIPNEKSDTIVQELANVARNKAIENKIIGYDADNTNLNFGGVNRNGKENVWRKLQKELGRHLFGIGCGAHITHNAIKAGCEMLPIDFEALLVNVFKHFEIHTTRTENLKSFCLELDHLYESMKSHSGTRFLSLNPVLQRIINMFDPLQTYFASLSQCPPSIKIFFSDLSSKFWLVFVENQTAGFNTSIERMERSSATSFKTAEELRLLKGKIKNRKELRYLPREAQLEKSKLSIDQQQEIDLNVIVFYDTIIKYIELWEESFDGTSIFSWMILSRYPDWNMIEESYEYAVLRFGENLRKVISRDQLCDEYGLEPQRKQSEIFH